MDLIFERNASPSRPLSRGAGASSRVLGTLLVDERRTGRSLLPKTDIFCMRLSPSSRDLLREVLVKRQPRLADLVDGPSDPTLDELSILIDQVVGAELAETGSEKTASLIDEAIHLKI